MKKLDGTYSSMYMRAVMIIHASCPDWLNRPKRLNRSGRLVGWQDVTGTGGESMT